MSKYSIREISEMFHMSASTIRYYEEMGILTNIERTQSGQRIFIDCHVNRFRTICCFKNAGMTISQLKAFFSYESAEPEHLDDILALLNSQKTIISDKIGNLQKDYIHIIKEIRYYEDVEESVRTNQPRPQWKDYKYRSYPDDK